MADAARDKIVIVTRKTQLRELVERFGTRGRAKFVIERSGGDFVGNVEADATYAQALDLVRAAVPSGVRVQEVEVSYVPVFLFGPNDLVIVVGQDGLVANVAKYLNGQPILAVNPDPARIDGALLPFTASADLPRTVGSALMNTMPAAYITMAKAELSDGQALYGVNDLFIGHQSHASARYRLGMMGRSENQSSSGVIVSTGAGSTGWFRSILQGAASVAANFLIGEGANQIEQIKQQFRFDWQSNFLFFSVREPFVSQISSAQFAFGRIDEGVVLEIESHMPQAGVIFSDGIEKDFLPFNSGAIARIGVADRRAKLLVKG